MTANTDPIFTLTSVLGMATIGTANTARDGSGAVGTVVIGGVDGTRISRVQIKALVTTTAGMIRLFLHDGSNYFLWKEIPVSAITVSATVAAFESTLELLGERALILPNGYSLQASTEKSESFNIIAEGGDY